jgi:hypothetical protein
MALTLFNNVSIQITDFEKRVIVPLLIDCLYGKTWQNTVTSKNLSAYLKASGYSVSEPRVRKLLSYVSIMNVKQGLEMNLGDSVVIGAGNGYFVTTEVRVVEDQIEDLTRRIDNMRNRIDSLRAQKLNLEHKKTA